MVPISLLYIKKFCVSTEQAAGEGSLSGKGTYGRCFSLYSCNEEKKIHKLQLDRNIKLKLILKK